VHGSIWSSEWIEGAAERGRKRSRGSTWGLINAQRRRKKREILLLLVKLSNGGE